MKKPLENTFVTEIQFEEIKLKFGNLCVRAKEYQFEAYSNLKKGRSTYKIIYFVVFPLISKFLRTLRNMKIKNHFISIKLLKLPITLILLYFRKNLKLLNSF